MLSCQEISKLVSESFERQLSLRERLSLRMHVTLCGTCRMFRRFQHHLHEALRKAISRNNIAEDDPSDQMPQEARSRLRQVITSNAASDSEPGHSSKDNGK